MGVDRNADSISFDHAALGGKGVTVFQNMESLEPGHDATARWVWDAAAPMARWLCDSPEVVVGRSVVELGAGPGLPGIVASRLGAASVTGGVVARVKQLLFFGWLRNLCLPSTYPNTFSKCPRYFFL